MTYPLSNTVLLTPLIPMDGFSLRLARDIPLAACLCQNGIELFRLTNMSAGCRLLDFALFPPSDKNVRLKRPLSVIGLFFIYRIEEGRDQQQMAYMTVDCT